MKRENIYNLLLFILMSFTILSIIILRPINNLDELWNYNFARNISDGLVPYRDFNMVITPLLSIICGIILRITFNELIVMRILAAMLCSTILFITYKIFLLIDIKKEVSIIFTFLIGCLLADLFCIDYNFATLLIVLLVIFSEIKYYKKDNELIKYDFKKDLILGILAGLTITLKQTTGIFICMVLLGNKLLFVKSKEQLKIYFKSFAYRLIGIVLPVLIMVIYLLANGAFSEFISYTIKGVSGFSNYISYKNLINWNLIGLLSILIPITFVYEWIKSVILERDKITYIICVYGLAMFVVCFPISDDIHFLIGALPTIIIILYEIYNLLKKICIKLCNNSGSKLFDMVTLFVSAVIFLSMIYYTSVNFYTYFKNTNFSDLKHYKHIPISKEFEVQILNISEYISTSNEDVKILDATAAVYIIPVDKYNKDYDMFNKGNLGLDGESRLKDEISNSKDTKYLILKEKFNKNWQTPLEIIEYVEENKTKVGEIEIFDIYK